MKGCCEILVQDNRCPTPLAHWHRGQEFKSRRKVSLSACPLAVPKTHPLLSITYLQVILCLFVFEAIVQLPSCSENKNIYFLANSASGPLLPSVKPHCRPAEIEADTPSPHGQTLDRPGGPWPSQNISLCKTLQICKYTNSEIYQQLFNTQFRRICHDPRLLAQY